jgi:hypothetical protein
MGAHAALKRRHRAERDGQRIELSLRIHRALSWLQRAEQLGDDPDGQFIFLWIAFNAAYANDFHAAQQLSEQGAFKSFLGKLIRLDGERGRIESLVWQEFALSIRTLLDNRYVFPDFWRWQGGEIDEAEWKLRFDEERTEARRALGRRTTSSVLAIVLTRIYVLRNQLVHGGATWNGRVNREQVRDCTRFMSRFVPLVIEILMDNPNVRWGPPSYPVVEDPDRPAAGPPGP